MYAKVINPRTHGKKVYDNKGSARRCANYLSMEAKGNGGTAQFFGAPGTGAKSADEVVALLDANHKGLGKDAPKFYSLVLSPSADEIRYAGNNTAILTEYTQHVMALYAKNFRLGDGRTLSEPDLVWAATIHQDRKNRGTDAGTQGEKKEGLQTHIHVLVSARDAAQQMTLSPLGTADRFNRVEFHAQSMAQMEVQIGPIRWQDATNPWPTRPQLVAARVADIKLQAAANKLVPKPLTPTQVAGKNARLETQVAQMNTKLDASQQLDPARVLEAAKTRNYDNVFYDRLGRLERNAERGTHTPSPYQYLTTGRVVRVAELLKLAGGPPAGTLCPIAPRRVVGPEMPAGLRALQQAAGQLVSAKAPSTMMQDLRNKMEKESIQKMQIPPLPSGEQLVPGQVKPGSPAAPLSNPVERVVGPQKQADEILRHSTTICEQILTAKNFTSWPDFQTKVGAQGYQFVTGMDGSDHLLHEASRDHFPLAQVRPHGRDLAMQVNEAIATASPVVAQSQLGESSTLAETVAPVVVTGQPLSPAALPASGLASGEAAVVAGSPLQPLAGVAEAERLAIPEPVKAPLASEAASGATDTNMPEMQGALSGQVAVTPVANNLARMALEAMLVAAEEEKQADTWYDWLKLGAQVHERVVAATHEALVTGVAFSTLLDKQGLDLLPATHDEPISVLHRVSGESFPAEIVPLPALLLTASSQKTAQYGIVQMADAAEHSASGRLIRVREALMEVGLTVGPVKPAGPGQPAYLAYAYSPQQADLSLVAARFDEVQASPRTWVLEAPHALQAASGVGYSHTEPCTSWADRKGQFNVARLEIENADHRAPVRADQIRQELREQGVVLGAVQTAGQGRLSFELRYHTLMPNIDTIDTILIRANNSAGIELQESMPSLKARAKGITIVAGLGADRDNSI